MAKIKGETLILKATFTDSSGVATDPSVPVTVTIKDPTGTKVVDEQSTTKDSVGIFTYTHTFAKAGLYSYRFKSADGSIEQKNVEILEDSTE